MTCDVYGDFLDDVRAGRPWVADSVEMCDPAIRAAFVCAAGIDPAAIEWIFFANDPDQCIRNAEASSDSRHGQLPVRLKLIPDYSPRYVIPEGITPLPVYGGQGDTNPEGRPQSA